MKGIEYVVDAKGKKKAAVVDLKIHAAAWEDFYDNIVSDMRVHEPRESFGSVKARLKKKGKIHG
jgi:hypothetical protein